MTWETGGIDTELSMSNVFARSYLNTLQVRTTASGISPENPLAVIQGVSAPFHPHLIIPRS